MLEIRRPDIPGGGVVVNYLEAFCRSSSTHQPWEKTVIPEKTEAVERSADAKFIRLLSHVEGDVDVHHEIRAGKDGVSFRVEAMNRGQAYADVVWAQPCIRVDKFTGRGQRDYTARSFIFVNGKATALDKTRTTEAAIYEGGQVFVPQGISREDVNPRPISSDVPSNGLIGCFSADGRHLLATAWQPYQELFQGVVVCLHSDFRLGGLKPGETKIARGKIYIMENDLGRLESRYRVDFGESS